jgi:hypothetical protein
MPMYEFEHKPSGERREFFYDMADAPEFGGKVRRDGKTWTRIFGQGPQLGPVWSRRFVAHSQEPGDPDAPHHVGPERIPAFTTQKEVDEYAAKKGLEYRDGRLGALKGKKMPAKKKVSASQKTGS